MHKTSSLSELGFDAGSASSAFFRPVADSSSSSSPLTPTAANRRLIKVSVIGAGNVGMAIAQPVSGELSSPSLHFFSRAGQI